MAILRTAKCDICNDGYTELDYGLGFPGWVQISGIGKERKVGEPHKHSDTNVMLCPKHGMRVAALMTDMEKEEENLNGLD